MVLTSVQKMEILFKYKNGNSMRAISTDMKINLKTINKWIKRFIEDNSLQRKKGTGLYKRKEVVIDNLINNLQDYHHSI